METATLVQNEGQKDEATEEFTAATKQATFERTHKRRAAESIFFGIVAVAIGVAMMGEGKLNAILVVLGAFLAIEGLWFAVKPTAAGLVVDGIALLLLGAWSATALLINISEGESFSLISAILAFRKFHMGIASFKAFGRYQFLNTLVRESEETIQDASLIQTS